MTFARATIYHHAVPKLLCEIEEFLRNGAFDNAKVEIARLNRIADNMETDGWKKAATWVRTKITELATTDRRGVT